MKRIILSLFILFFTNLIFPPIKISASEVSEKYYDFTKDWTRANFHATDNYGIPDTKMNTIDEFLMDYFRENVPEDAAYEDVTANGYMDHAGRKSRYGVVKGYCFSYTEKDTEKQIAIFDYVSKDSVYRADKLWIDITNIPILNVYAKVYAYENKEWKYIENVKPYVQKNGEYDGRLLVSGEQWENHYKKSRILITVTTEINPPEGAGYVYRPTVLKRHHNTIWIGNYPIEFYWKDAFKVFLWIGISATILIILIRKRVDNKKYK